MKKNNTSKAEEAPYTLKQFLLDTLQVVGSALVLTFIILIFIQPCMVSGPSMKPTYQNKDFLILWKLGDVERNDIVAFDSHNGRGKNGEGEDYIKRVIAVGGDHLVIRDSVVMVNGEIIDEPYILESTFNGNIDITVSDGYVFVMGDNRNNSTDSRIMGEINTEDILGKVLINFNKVFRDIKNK